MSLISILTSRNSFKLNLCLQGSYLLAASNDFASRIWTVDDNRLRVSLLMLGIALSCISTSVSYRGSVIFAAVHLQALSNSFY